MSSKEVSKWADTAMWHAEPSERDKGTRALLVSANPDPLGEIAALNKMYTGTAVHDLADITDDERREVLGQIQKTVLKMPLEIVNLHFLLEGVHRGITHQMVRQRTGAYAQESMRFAVKEDMAEAVAYPPSLADTVSWDDYQDQVKAAANDQGIYPDEGEIADMASNSASREQRWRREWDEAVEAMAYSYKALIEDGMPAEEARGLAPTNVLTKLHYTTNLRAFYDTMAMRVSDQAQFEWRELITAMVKAMRDYGARQTYSVWTYHEDEAQPGDLQLGSENLGHGSLRVKVGRSSAWQFEELTNALRPIDFQLGRRGFGSDVDRPSRIGERVDAFAKMGVPSDQWLTGSVEHSIPRIHPDEWLLDPNSARLNHEQEFDVFGNRVTKGTGWHWSPDHGGYLYCEITSGEHAGRTQYAALNSDGPSWDRAEIIKQKEQNRG